MNINSEVEEYIKKRHYSKINRVLLWKDGHVLADRYYNGYDESSRNVIKSIAKSIMSIGTGIALDKGLIKSLNEPIRNYIPEFNTNMEPYHKFITIRHLLTMTSGIYWNGGVHYHCPMLSQMRRSGDWILHISDCIVSHMPGTNYTYKEWDVILLAKILDYVCGDMYDFINDNLYKPLRIESERWYKSDCGVYYSVADGDEEKNESTSNLTAFHLLNIGRLFLNGGTFEGRQIVSQSYINQSLSSSRCNPGYGFLCWVGDDWYGCRGYGGQSITVFPKKNAIIVTQATPTSRGMSYDDVIPFCKEFI